MALKEEEAAMSIVTVIHCWSAPRSRSTALMYSFDARDDCQCVDEPLYRQWLIDRKHIVTRPYMQQMVYGNEEGVHVDAEGPDAGGNAIGNAIGNDVGNAIGNANANANANAGVNDNANDNDDDNSHENDAKWKRETFDLKTRIINCLTFKDGNISPQIVFVKHMAKHSQSSQFDLQHFVGTFTEKVIQIPHSKHGCEKQTVAVTFTHKHLLLIRDPVAILSSWKASSDVHADAATTDEVGIIPILSVYSSITSQTSTGTSTSTSSNHTSKATKEHEPIISVLDSNDLASSNPAAVLENICQQLNIPFTTQMLSWEKGPKACDGPWAPWWYHNVHSSTHFSPTPAPEPELSNSNLNSNKKYHTLDPKLLPTLRASLPAYNYLQQLSVGYQQRGPPPADIYEDPRNEHVLVFIGAPGCRNGRLIPRQLAGISPWDSSVQGGDATWEGTFHYICTFVLSFCNIFLLVDDNNKHI